MHFTLGRFDCHLISDGDFWIDGGTAFGVVPKAMWQKWMAPDAENRVPLALNCLVVRTPDALVLVETGIGSKLGEKDRLHHRFTKGVLLSELAKAGFAPADFDLVINTHLHFDHAGGNTFRAGDELRTTFPRAKYVAQRREWDDATHPDGLTAAGYDSDDFLPVEEAGQLTLVDGTVEVAPGVVVEWTGGHSRGHQMIVLRSRGETACFPGDIMPGPAWVRPSFITAYDLNQIETYAAKLRLLDEAHAGRWLMVWGHDGHQPLSRITKNGDRYEAVAAT
jgi:glyoxylase-like metal-dependent hydrolase (beta-lactamase superfamily II)